MFRFADGVEDYARTEKQFRFVVVFSATWIGPNEHGVMFYAESQGPWNGS